MIIYIIKENIYKKLNVVCFDNVKNFIRHIYNENTKLSLKQVIWYHKFVKNIQKTKVKLINCTQPSLEYHR